MHRLLLLMLIPVFALGCQSTTNGPRLLLSPDQAKKIDLKLAGGLAGDTAGFLYLQTPDNVMRYDPKSNQIEPMLLEACSDIRDVAVTSEGVVLVLRPRELDAYLAGRLLKLSDLPAEALTLSCDRQFAYILVTRGAGSKLLRYHLTGATGAIEELLTLEDRPQALSGVPAGCLVASGGNIVKVSDPAGAIGENGPHVSTILLVALGEQVTSVAVDPRTSYLYFATKDATFVWAQGQILPVFPAGSRLLWVDDTLTICQPSIGQIVQIGSVSSQVQKTLTGLQRAGPAKR